MIRYIALVVTVMMTSCNAPPPIADDICKLPKTLAGWSGVDVHWRGIVIGTFEHGFVLISENCLRRGIQLGDWPSTPSGDLLEETLRREWREPGLVRVGVSGKIAGRRLLVQEIHAVSLVPMSEDARRKHLRSLGF